MTTYRVKTKRMISGVSGGAWLLSVFILIILVLLLLLLVITLQMVILWVNQYYVLATHSSLFSF